MPFGYLLTKHLCHVTNYDLRCINFSTYHLIVIYRNRIELLPNQYENENTIVLGIGSTSRF